MRTVWITLSAIRRLGCIQCQHFWQNSLFEFIDHEYHSLWWIFNVWINVIRTVSNISHAVIFSRAAFSWPNNVTIDLDTQCYRCARKQRDYLDVHKCPTSQPSGGNTNWITRFSRNSENFVFFFFFSLSFRALAIHWLAHEQWIHRQHNYHLCLRFISADIKLSERKK